MNSKQKLAFLLGVIVIAIMGLNPPWKEAGPKGLPLAYAPIYQPPVPLRPDHGMEIDLARLLLQIGIAAVLTGGLIAASAPPPSTSTLSRVESKPVDSAPSSPPQLKIVRGKDDEEEEDDEEDEDEDGDEVEDDPNVIRLPSGKSFGEFLIESEDDPDYWESLTEAKGVIRLPVDKRIQLEVRTDKNVDLSFVSAFTPSSLYSVDLTDATMNDWDLAYLQKLTELKELDLSSSSISSQALTYLRGLDNLEKLWLDDTKIDDSGIEALKHLESLKKLSVKNTKLTADGISRIKEMLVDCQIET